MKRPFDWQDLIGGSAVAAAGLFFGIYAQQWEIGSLSRMGPAFLPTVLSALLFVIGLSIALTSLGRAGKVPRLEWRALTFVLSGIALFSLLLHALGLLAATFFAVLASGMADRTNTWRRQLVLATGITILVVLIFKAGLGMVVPLWRFG